MDKAEVEALAAVGSLCPYEEGEKKELTYLKSYVALSNILNECNNILGYNEKKVWFRPAHKDKPVAENQPKKEYSAYNDNVLAQ